MSIYDKFESQAVDIPRRYDGAVSHDLLQTEFIEFEVDPTFHTLDQAVPGAPTLGLLNKIGAPKQVKTPVYFMIRKKPFERFLTLGGAYTTGTTVTIDSATNAARVKAGWYVMNTLTREMLRVVSISGADLTVEREVGSVAKANSISTNDELIILGYRGAEGDGIAAGFIRTPSIIFNYVGELQDGYEVTQYADGTSRRVGGKTLDELRMDKLEDMRQNLEWALFFDQRAKSQRSSDDKWVWTTGGVDSFLTENETDFGGTMTEAKLITACRSIKRHDKTRTRWVCASPEFMEQLQQMIAAGLSSYTRQASEQPTELGIDVVKVNYGGLKLYFFEHPLFDDAVSTHDNSLRGHAYVLDLTDLELVTMKTRKMGFFKWFMNVETPGSRNIVDQLICNFGVRMALPERHARWYNVS